AKVHGRRTRGTPFGYAILRTQGKTVLLPIHFPDQLGERRSGDMNYRLRGAFAP
ncbi:Hypothetical predicted protein, partial [Pelobates cultripes]